ncbi:MAG: hypothetical protein PHY48_02725 [Candidatus Cloacimonetes bacterium]|nr:hypothetical protein [Candidatus Cloacimonadota bacterium]
MRARISGLTKNEQSAFLAFLAFTGLFFLNYIVNQVNIIWAFFQYYKYFFPVALYFAIKGLKLNSEGYSYYGQLIIKLLWFQIAFSVTKLLVIGFRENVIGSISNTGGGIGVGYAILGTIMYWTMRGKNLQGKDWWFVLLLLIIPGASNKRAIWFMYPIIIALLMLNGIDRKTLRKISTIIMLVPIIIYVGFRLNPTLNPEKQLWGSFDIEYALDYALSYSGASEEKLSGEYAQGRFGASSAIIITIIKDPFSLDALLGVSRSRMGRMGDDFNPEDYGLLEGTMTSSIGYMSVQMGWLATLLIISVFFRLIYTIPDRKIAGIIAFYVLWDLVLYSGQTINGTIQSVLLILSIHIIKHYSVKSDNSGTNQGSSDSIVSGIPAVASVRVR